MYTRSSLPDIRTSYWDSSGVYICKSEENDLKHGNYICTSEVIYHEGFWLGNEIISCDYIIHRLQMLQAKQRLALNSSGVYICKSWKLHMLIRRKLPDIRTSYWDSCGVYTCKSEENYLYDRGVNVSLLADRVLGFLKSATHPLLGLKP